MRIRTAREQGKPTKVEQAASKRAQKEQERKAKLSAKQKIFADTLALQVKSGGRTNLTSAAITAGYAPSVAGDIGPELVRDRSIQRRVLESLALAGITQETLAATARDGLQANDTKVVTYEGKVTDKVELPDHHARFKYWESLNRIFGNFPKDENIQQAALIVKMPTDSSPEQAETALAMYFNGRQVTPELARRD